MEMEAVHPIRRIAVIGNYLPRQCGIATFTTDLCEAIASKYEDINVFSLPVNDTEDGYRYPPRVRFELEEKELSSYHRAADFLNINNVDLVCLQHEYGIYGGTAGSHILALLRELRMPVVTTLHTILKEPDPKQRSVMETISQISDRLVVMSQRGSEFLQEIYHVPQEKIDLIPHGIHDVPFVDPNFYKDKFGVEGKSVLLTFGLLSPNKGIEFVIRALPEILEHDPNLVYIVLGATHPQILRHEGETYRLYLQQLAHEKGVEKNVIFYDRFVSPEELEEFIGAADIYLTPYLSQAQTSSGTLAYSLGAGKAIVSTPYWYAEELLSEERGKLVPFHDAKAIARSVIELLDNETMRHAIRKRAYLYGREMIWPKVAQSYMETFTRARHERSNNSPRAFVASTMDRRPISLPVLNLDHLQRMTDGTGMLQHAVYTVPNYNEGYCTDDNARALIVSVLLEEIGGESEKVAADLSPRYLAFLWHAYNNQNGRFRNFFSYDRRWLEEIGSEDSHARSLWGLGVLLGHSKNEGLRGPAGQLFEMALPAVVNFTHARPWAFALKAISEYLKPFDGDRAARTTGELLAEHLMELYKSHSSDDWVWFENELTYSNANLPHALLLSGQWLQRNDIIDTALKTLEWLVNIQCSPEGYFAPIGSNGFYPRGGERARYDQQPIEVQSTISACLEAYRVTKDMHWRKEAERAFEWFLGRNELHISLYDPTSGGCRDGLRSDRANQNQGAESTLVFLHSLLELKLAEEQITS
jgi:glycosyltransferase involved in cell wall biosynthesis